MLAGTGSTSDPVIISATDTAIDCADVRPCMSEGPGIDYDPVTGVISARLSTDAGNATIIGTDGGLYSPSSGGGGLTAVTSADTPCIDLSGLGTAGSPLQAAPIVDPVAGNLLACSPTGLRALLATATCGLQGNGSAAAPLSARVGVWPYPCPVDANAGNVYCDSAGTLRSEPRGRISFVQQTDTVTYANLAVPAAQDTLIETRTFDVTNPDTCREAELIVAQELDVDLVLPTNAGGAYGFGTDEMVFHSNRGGTTENDFHVQVMKVGRFGGPIPPGGMTTLSLPVTMGRGAGGATYNRIQHFFRVWIISL
ncbi:hypothetical protein [Nonomuraea rubra]|uniref:hypothetical protein n=1 Tax=Nonomuraea rubra TaxID=46180 RepID=UPI0033E52793